MNNDRRRKVSAARLAQTLERRELASRADCGRSEREDEEEEEEEEETRNLEPYMRDFI